MKRPSPQAPPPPWYKQPYVWLLITFPAAAVLGGIVTIYIAVLTDDGLVTDDYYKRGLQINRSLARDRLADKMDLSATVDWAAAESRLAVVLAAKDMHALPAQLQLRLFHSTRGGLDQAMLLPQTAAGRYGGRAPDLAPGAWNIELGTSDWRLLGRMEVPGPRRVELVPVVASR